MDRVTRSYMNAFCEKYDMTGEEYLKYEHFVNYIIMEQYCYENYDFRDVNIGHNGTIGIDGFAIIINGIFIDNEENLLSMLDSHNNAEAEVIFIQTKTSSGFDIKDISHFGLSVGNFISEDASGWEAEVLEKINLFNILIENTSKLKDKPNCYLYYVTAGIKRDDDFRDIRTIDLLKPIKNENVFSEIEFNFFGTNEIQKFYKKIGTKYKAKFNFPNKVILPEVDELIPKSYLGIIPAKILIDIITDEENNLISEIFYDNVRDYQGSKNPVNSEIVKTLESEHKNMFFAMNNGVTIISEEIHDSRDSVEIEGFQIINGCQTSNVLFENKENISDDVYVPIRLISTSDEGVMSKIIRATNRQSEVKEQDLIAFTDFQKSLEDFYSSQHGENKLYYERRAKQYNKSNIKGKFIIDKTAQIKSFTSYFFNTPDTATRNFSTLFRDFKEKLFKKEHSYCGYYMVAFLLFRLNEVLRKKIIDKKFNKIKFFILMMLKYEFREIINEGKKEPNLEKNDYDKKYCDKILKYALDENKIESLIIQVTEKILLLEGYDLDSQEISRSSDFKKDCIFIYQNNKE